VATLAVGVLLFWSAGTLHWPRGWIFIGLFSGSLLANLSLMLWKAPSRATERWKRRADTKPFDKVFSLAYSTALVALFVLAGLDAVRYHWTSMPDGLVYLGAALHFAGMGPVLWVLLSNPHAESTVRIQTDRDHRVVSTGPYRFVRHPMYVAIILPGVW
jgi:protein-S-isoprenylcysteine O-methyltransferase Ste14